jgi:hypothetical protein
LRKVTVASLAETEPVSDYLKKLHLEAVPPYVRTKEAAAFLKKIKISTDNTRYTYEIAMCVKSTFQSVG